MFEISLILILLLFFTVKYKLLLSKSNSEFFLKVLFLYIFIFGVLEYYMVLASLRKFLIDILIIILCFLQLNKKNFEFPGIKWFFIFSFLFFLSVIITSSAVYPSFTYYRTFLYPYIVFLITYNLKMPPQRWITFNKFIYSLFILQILASVLKYLFLGVYEKVLVGTVTSTGGAFSTMIPLAAIAFVFSLFMIYRQDYKYILISLGFLFMGYVGAKRGLWLYLPVVLLAGIFFYFNIKGSRVISQRLIRLTIIIITFSFFTIIFGSKYTRSLNPENRVGGSFELDYLKEYTIDYTFSTSSEDNLGQGRGANFISVIKNMINTNWINMLFGFGPAAGKGVATYGEGIWKTLGVNGPVTGLTYHLVQLGILTNIIIILITIRLSLSLFRLSKSESDLYLKSMIFGGFMVTIVFLIDFLTYSSSFISTLFPLSFSYAYFSAIIYKNPERNLKYIIAARN